ncbi:MAG: hypothetical protein NTZ07_02275 [Candidatus Woesebacteria bacterium]|nr:hypothetical protein [Candidatus Woesebacteria bacterium]
MERVKAYDERSYLTCSAVAQVLQVSNQTLYEMVVNGIVKPPHIPRRNGKNLWGPEEIFRAFLCLRLTDEFRKKYGNEYDEYLFDQVRCDILSARRVRGREILKSKEWADVTERAANKGLNLLDLQKVELNRGLPSED